MPVQQAERFLFHGGCHGCKRQIHECPDCRYFECNWKKPDLNDSHAEREKEQSAMRRFAIMMKQAKEREKLRFPYNNI